MIFDWWPFVLKWTYEQVRRENYTLRSALQAANAELRNHRLLLADLRAGHEKTTSTIERIFADRERTP